MTQAEIVKKIHGLFKSKKLKLAVAESCTAGLISHMLTSRPGASEFFDSAVICYSSKSKKILLGLRESLLSKHGAVSEIAAVKMAEAIRRKIQADFSLAITGNIGPSALEGKKVGLVFMAVSFDRDTESRGMIFDGSREEIKQSAALAALAFLYETVSVWG